MFCPDCGKKTSEDDLFCGNCGAQLRAIFVPLKPNAGTQQNKVSNTQQKPAQSSYPSAFSKPQAGTTSKYAPKPQQTSASKAQPISTPKPQAATVSKPQHASTPKPQPQPQQVNEPKPQPVSAPKPEPTAAPKPVQTIVSIPQQGNLPKEVCRNADGKLTWFYRDLEKDPSGNYVIKYVFEDDYIARYDGIDLSAKAGQEAEVNMRYYYKRVTIVERHQETGWIYFRHGIDRYFLQVSNAQFDYILAEFMKRCPNSEMGIVKVWKD